jgi:hypothetical protein
MDGKLEHMEFRLVPSGDDETRLGSVILGDPSVPANFEYLDFIVKGWHLTTPALTAAGLTGVGQLNPWPGEVLNGPPPPPATQAGVACAAR